MVRVKENESPHVKIQGQLKKIDKRIKMKGKIMKLRKSIFTKKEKYKSFERPGLYSDFI